MEDVMASKVPTLEKLATKEVGATNSQLIFVTEEGVVRAVFTSRSDFQSAVNFANTLSRRRAVIVEDHTGVAWENEESARQQQEEDE
jgi:hypothetical protein